MADDEPAAPALRWERRVDALRHQCVADGVDPDGLTKVQDIISGVLFSHDPAGAAASGQADEYAREAQTVALQLHQTRSEADVAALVRAELTWWFSPETGTATGVQAIAAELWPLTVRP